MKRRYLLDRILAHDLALLSEAPRRPRGARGRPRRARARGRPAPGARRARRRTGARRRRRGARSARRCSPPLRGARGFHERAASEAAAQATQARRRSSRRSRRRAPARSGPAGFAGAQGAAPAAGAGTGHGRVRPGREPEVQHRHASRTGVDVAAPAGAPVRAVAPGRVVHAGWFKGYGNLVIVDHGDGYHTLVAHLGSMQTAMGEEVDAGRVLGTVGDSGSLEGRLPLLRDPRERAPRGSRAPGSRLARQGARLVVMAPGRPCATHRGRCAPPSRARARRRARRPRSSRGSSWTTSRGRARATPRSRTGRSTSSPTCSRTSRTATSRT